jgi:hypothetical protein
MNGKIPTFFDQDTYDLYVSIFYGLNERCHASGIWTRGTTDA